MLILIAVLTAVYFVLRWVNDKYDLEQARKQTEENELHEKEDKKDRKKKKK